MNYAGKAGDEGKVGATKTISTPFGKKILN